MTYYIKRGTSFLISSEANLDIHKQLPVGNYIIQKNPMTEEFYLEQVDSFEFNGKRYGDNIRHTNRILDTFLNREVSTGVMLSGEKGSGKSLLAKTIAIQAATLDIPTIIINAPWGGDKFNSFIQDIQQPCVVLFDEFEKVYDREEQESILTLLDGVFPTKKLFILTCNDPWKVDSHMRNRPGRIYYLIDFVGLKSEFIAEYCEDNLINKTYIDTVCRIASVFTHFNFDMLKALIEEMNRYDECPQDALQMLNINPELSDSSEFVPTLTVNGVVIPQSDLYSNAWEGNPLSGDFGIEYKVYKDNRTDYDYRYIEFCPNDLTNVNITTGQFNFTNRTGDSVMLVRVPSTKFKYDAF